MDGQKFYNGNCFPSFESSFPPPMMDRDPAKNPKTKCLYQTPNQIASSSFHFAF